ADERTPSARPLMEEQQRIGGAAAGGAQRVGRAAAQPCQVAAGTHVRAVERERAAIGEGGSRDVAGAEGGVAPVGEQFGIAVRVRGFAERDLGARERVLAYG